jgi:hypothetical protein
MKHRLLHAFGLMAAAVLALGAGSAAADAIGPYYASPSWDQTLPSSTRFIVLSNWSNAAVLDRETGLVWEKSPSTTSMDDVASARFFCNQVATGGRSGWRVPKIQELQSLRDPSVTDPSGISNILALQAGHPFSNVQAQLTIKVPFPQIQSAYYWSDSEVKGFPNDAWAISFDASKSLGNLSFGSSGTTFVWCVRGGTSADIQ